MSDFRIETPGGHLDQMVRQTRAHHVQLSSLADVKASVLLTTAALVVPLTLRLVDDPDLRLPALVMTAFSLLTVLLAAYATMPKIGKRPLDASGRPRDLLFFGDFAAMERDAWLAAMQDTMNDPSRAYETQLKEIYALGGYLMRAKYRWIRLAYQAFVAGVVLSAATYVGSRILAPFLG